MSVVGFRRTKRLRREEGELAQTPELIELVDERSEEHKASRTWVQAIEARGVRACSHSRTEEACWNTQAAETEARRAHSERKPNGDRTIQVLLAIDVGNTNTVLAAFDGDRLAHSWRVRTDSRMTADELALLYSGLLATQGVKVTGVALCSTVPAVRHELRTMLDRYYAGLPTVIIEPGVKTGVQLAYDNPKEVGSDRVMNTLAAYQLYGGPTIVVDFGTSTNYDVIGASGEFLGGALAPGIEISVDALASRAAQLLKVELVRPRSVIGKNTVEALQSGLVYGFAAQVDGLVRRITEELADVGPVRAVVATGGLAPLVVGESQTITHHEPNLTLIGLRMVYTRSIPLPHD